VPRIRPACARGRTGTRCRARAAGRVRAAGL